MLNALKSLFPTRGGAAVLALKPRRRTSLAPAVVLAAGAGAALWWWTQWARGASEEPEADASGPPTDETPRVSSVLDAEATKSLDESLAVQADPPPDAATV